VQLALPTASGMQAVNVGVTVGGPVPGSVPAGEGSTVPEGLVALGLLAAAGGLLAAQRKVVTGCAVRAGTCGRRWGRDATLGGTLGNIWATGRRSSPRDDA
jgi:hypothetical protein